MNGLKRDFDAQYEQLDGTSNSLVRRNSLVSASVEEMGKLRSADTATVSSEAAEWGEANREVGQMLQQSQQQGRSLQEMMQEHQDKVSDDIDGMSLQSKAWAKNNAAVAEKTLAEAVATSKSQEAVVEATAATQKHVQAVQTEVKC